jgi:hypothetical protein
LFSSAFQKSDGIEDEMKDKLQKFRGSESALFHFLFLLLVRAARHDACFCRLLGESSGEESADSDW